MEHLIGSAQTGIASPGYWQGFDNVLVRALMHPAGAGLLGPGVFAGWLSVRGSPGCISRSITRHDLTR